MKQLLIGILFICLGLFACQDNKSGENGLPVIGFADAFEDNTIADARKGFFDALAKQGFSEDKKTIKVVYRNAQGSIPTLTQIIKYFISEEVDIIAACPSLATITAVQNTKDIPVFMMVSPTPQLMKIAGDHTTTPANLYGVGENLDYIETSFSIIPELVKSKGSKLSVGVIYNQSEPQSVEALEQIKKIAAGNNVTLETAPVNTSADVQMVTRSLLSKGIDAFFANPDNTVFASFETIVKSCNDANVPVFTSESGLVKRGAVAAYGADIYQWGYQAGEQAAKYLNGEKDLKWEMVKERKRVYNPEAAKRFGIHIPDTYLPVQ